MGITERQYSIVKQPIRELYCKVNLLNYKFQIVDDISGVVVNDSWNISANSDIRRTGTLTILPDDDQVYKIQAGSKIFLDKYVQVYIGIKDNLTDEIIYNNMGIYLINNPSHTFDSTNNQITLQLVDLMAKLTGMRNGNLDGYEYQMLTGQNVRDIFIAVLAKVGFTNCIINILPDDYQTIQFDMSVDGTSTLYDILSTINKNQYVNYQMYFDIDGVFHFEPIPSGSNASIMVDDDIWDSTYISHEVSTNYEDLKNHIIVLGKTHTSDNYCDIELTKPSDTWEIKATCAGIKRERNHMKISFTTPSDCLLEVSNQGMGVNINLNSYGAFPLKTTRQFNHMDSTDSFFLRPDTYYVAKSQNIVRWTARVSGAKRATTYTLEQPIELEDGQSPSDIIGCYISKNAKSRSKAVAENITITAYDEINKTITVSKTLDKKQALSKRLFYIYKNDTSDVYWEFMGEYQPRAEVEDLNPSSPFYVNGEVGDIKITLAGGDYDNISTSELALERAKWELYTRCRLLDSLNLVCLPIYWLDVNWLVSITLPTETEPKLFIIKDISISGGVTGTQTINLMSFYDFYTYYYTEHLLLDSDNNAILDSNNNAITTIERN
jgi:hypothetical protein